MGFTWWLPSLISRYLDVALLDATKGIQNLIDYRSDIQKSEQTFIAEFASGTSCLIFLYLEAKTSEVLLDDGGFASLKEFILEKYDLFGLKKINGMGEILGSFEQIQ